MRTLKLMMVVMLLGGVSAVAQKKGERKGHMEKLDEIVQLTDDQKTQIQALNKEFREKAKELRSAEPVDKEALKTLRKGQKEKINAVLTEAQKEKLEAHKEAQKAKHKAAREEIKAYKEKNIKPVMKARRAEVDAFLTQEEKDAIAALRKEFRGERKGKKDKSGERPSKEDRSAKKEKMESVLLPIVEAHRAELESVLKSMEAQEEQWKADMKQIREKHLGSEQGKRKRKEPSKDARLMRFLMMKG